MDKICCGAVQVENGFPFWAAAAEKHALANRWYCIALLSVVLFLSAYNRCADNSTAADEQKCAPQNEIAAVTGFWRGSISGLVGLISRLRRRTRCGNFNGGLLIATDGAFLVLGASRGCGGFLIDHPLEAMRCRVLPVTAGAFMPMVICV